ncbi:MAG TPA: hypothetical protein VK858_13975 [Longimicrobiales bacterium]|nr:hypothetical protein [Longimicrobiales bacterium]
MSFRNHERKLVQWTAAYVVSAFAILQVTDLLMGIFPWPQAVQQTLFVLLLFGLPTAVVIAWFHGEKGRQRVSFLEVVLITVITVAGVAAANAVARRGSGSAEPTVSVPEEGVLRYAVVPFRGAGDILAGVDRVVHDALSRWSGVDVVDPLDVQDAVDRRGGLPRTVGEGREIARELGATRLVSGDVTRAGEQVRIRLALHDASGGALLADTILRMDAEASLSEPALRSVVDGLLFGSMGLDLGDDPAPTTRSFPARVALLQGFGLLREWRLDGAAERFEDAGELDPVYARAHLWRAQALHWDDQRGANVQALLERAVPGRGALTPRERSLLDALLLLERGRFPEACTVYAGLRDQDDTDFAAWYGLGKCHAWDTLVVEDPSSPSGWSFRASHYRGVRAYQRAFELIPSAFLDLSSDIFAQAMQELYAASATVKVGRTAPPESAPFAAYPALMGDTLAFVPFTFEQIGRGETPGVSEESQQAAVEMQRRVLGDLTEGWLAAYPRNPEALSSYALALDLMGDPAATLDTLASIRSRTTDEGLILQLGVSTAPRLIKYGIPDRLDALRRGRALADSLLVAVDRLTPSDELSAIATLAGRVFLAAEIARGASEEQGLPVVIPVQVMGPADALAAYAAVGAPRDSVLVWETRVLAAVQNRIPASQRAEALHRLLDRTATLAAPTGGLATAASLAESTDFVLLRALEALRSGRTDEARSLWAQRAETAPQRRTLDILYPEAWLAVELGDTTSAVGMLEEALSDLRWLDRPLDDPTWAGSLVRAMALRASLAEAAGDPEIAGRWAQAVLILWDDADPPLQPLVTRMRALIGSARDPPGGGARSPSR